MHLDYYQLSTDPFRLTPDYRFAYPHRAYQAARESMQQAFSGGDGVLVLSGRAGTGKTTLVQEFLDSISGEEVTTATVVGTRLAESGFLQLVAHAFGLNPSHDERGELLELIQRHLSQAVRSLLVVDEAQNLSTTTLEEVGLLSCLEMAPGQHLQVFLIGQEGLPANLDAPAVAQLRQRVTATCSMTVLGVQECSDYVMHRLAVAGWRGKPAIDSGVMVLLHRYSQGLPRHLCKLCSRLLLHGAVAEKNSLDVRDVAEVVEALREEMLLPKLSDAAGNGPIDTAGLQDAGAAGARALDEIITLTAQEEAYLATAPVVFDRSRPVEAVSEAGAETVPDALTEAGVESDAARRTPVDLDLTDTLAATGDFDTTGASPPWMGAAAAMQRKRLPAILSLAAVAMLVLVALGYFLPLGPEPERIAIDRDISTVSPQEPVIQDVPPAVLPTDVASAQTSVGQAGLLEFITPQAVAIDLPAQLPGESLAEIVTTVRPITPLQTDSKVTPGTGRDEQVGERALMDPALEALLERGERALERNYLTTPEETNAYDYYTAVLELDPDNESARKGMVAIADLYAVMANTMLEQRNLRNAGVFIRRGLFVLPEHPPLIALQWQLDRELAGSKTASAAGLDIEKLAPAAL